jgi:hypothetical protein
MADRKPLWKKAAENLVKATEKKRDKFSRLPRFGWQWPDLHCLACGRHYFPWSDTPVSDLTSADQYPDEIKLVKTRQVINGSPLYELAGREPELLELADMEGWRIIHLYGHDFVVCPDCLQLPSTPLRRLV